MRRWIAKLRQALAGWPAWRLTLGFLCSVCVWGIGVCIILAWLSIFDIVAVSIPGLALTAAALYVLAGIFALACRWSVDEHGDYRPFEPEPVDYSADSMRPFAGP